MIIRQILARVDHAVHIGFHQVSDDVNVFEACHCRWLGNVNQGNDVLMVEEFQQFDFTHNTFGVNQVLECFGDFFDCHLDL